MEVPPIGFVIMAIVGIVAFSKPHVLIYLSAFFVPFSGTSVMNLAAFELGVVAFTFTAVVWLVSNLVQALSMRLGRVTVTLRDPVAVAMIWFLLVVALSLFMPFIIDGRDHFDGAGILGDVKTHAIRFSSWHIVHVGYVLIGVAFVLTASAVLRKKQRIESLVRWYVLGGAFAAGVGLLEVVFDLTGLSFPVYYLNTVPTTDLTGTGGRRLDGELGLLRISSVSQEPSVFGGHLAVVFAFVWTHLTLRRRLFSKSTDIGVALVITGALIFSLSSVAYAGLGIVVGLTALLSLSRRRGMFRMAALLGVLCIMLVAAARAVSESEEIVNYFILEKTQSGSFLERATTIVNAFDLALRYPVLGVGWGLVPSFDLIVKIFVGAGLVGLFVFFRLWVSIFLALLQIRRTLRRSVISSSTLRASGLAEGMLVGFLTLTLIYIVNGFEYRYGDFWILLTLVVAMRQRYPWTPKSP